MLEIHKPKIDQHIRECLQVAFEIIDRVDPHDPNVIIDTGDSQRIRQLKKEFLKNKH